MMTIVLILNVIVIIILIIIIVVVIITIRERFWLVANALVLSLLHLKEKQKMFSV